MPLKGYYNLQLEIISINKISLPNKTCFWLKYQIWNFFHVEFKKTFFSKWLHNLSKNFLMLSIFNTTISIKRKNILFKHHNFLYFDMIFLNRKNNYFWRKTTVALLVVTQKDDVQSIFCFNFKCDSTFTSDVCCSIKRRNIKRRYKTSFNKASRLLNFFWLLVSFWISITKSSSSWGGWSISHTWK
jgi:hypothetical protein